MSNTKLILFEVNITSWEKKYYIEKPDEEISMGNYIIIETSQGEEIGKIIASVSKDIEKFDEKEEELAKYVRKSSKEDIERALEMKKKLPKAVSDCKAMVNKHDLPMKLVDAHFSIDEKRLTFAFISNGRVDFRGLLKDLVKQFKLNIRLQQIGIRDEIKINGDLGCCGKVLCCRSFYYDLGNVTSDLADLQQVSHRGSERLSGVCGRLKCCLNYEKEVYQEKSEGLPPVGTRVKTKKGRGKVVGWHTLRRSVDVYLDEEKTVVEIPIE
jgi:cell fate regulator YaaT (PSP1 superfamily)